MADYRKRLVDMTDEERAEVAPGSPQFSEDYENVDDPLSVQMMEAGLDFTPVGTAKGISDIKDELSRDDPNYLKAIGMGAVEAAALIPGLGSAAKSMIRRGGDTVKGSDNVIDATSRIPKVPSIRKDFDNFDFNELNLSDAELEDYADIYKRAGSKESLAETKRRITSIIKDNTPKIEKALVDALDTGQGTVSLQDYKNALAATVDYDSIRDAAKGIARRQQLLNKMSTSIGEDMAFDDAADAVFDRYFDKAGSNKDLTEALLSAGYQRELVDFAVSEKAIRNSYNKFMSTKAPRSKPATVQIDRDTDALEASRLRNDPEALEQWRTENKLPETQRQKNLPDAQAAAQALIEGSVTSKEARKRITEAFPEPREYTSEEVMELLPTLTEVQGALGKKGTRYPILGVDGADLAEGQVVSSRLDIPAYDDYDKWVVSIHDGNQKSGSVVGYGQAIRLKNIRFGSDADTALDIARGTRTSKATGQDAIDKKTGEPAKQSKATIARIFGEYTSEDPYDLQRQAADIIASGSDEWVQVGMNPYRGSAFYDKKTGMPVFEAEEIIQVGPLVLAKNVKKPTISQMKEMAVRTKDGKLRMFNEGGIAMDKQMEMAFAEGGTLDLDSVPDNTQGVDPVSGNEVPLGSMPEEVRDDIPAQLSEGEYVVPADVVRYYGVKFFEDIRNAAKRGFAEMEANGRIGGEPVGMEMAEDELPFDISELQIVDDEAEEQPMMSMGGYMRGYADGGLTTSSAVTDMVEATGISPMPSSTFSGIEMKEYVGPSGEVMYIQFINGVAQSVIPEGYTSKDATPTALAAPAGLGIVAPPEDNNNTAHDDMMKAAEERDAIDWSSPDVGIEQYEKTLEQNNSLLAKGFSGLATVLGGPIVGGFIAVAKRHQNAKMLEGATARLEDPNVKGAEREKWTSIHNRLSGLDEDGKASNSFTEGLANILTPADGMEYVNGVLIEKATGKILKPGIANSIGNDVVAPTPTPTPKPQPQPQGGGGDNSAHKDMMSQASKGSTASKARARATATRRGNVSDKTASKLSGSQMKAGSGVGSNTDGTNYAGPMNKGGLMKKKKK